VSERRAGRAPELEQSETLAWIGRLLARLHAVGRREPFSHRRTLDMDTFGRRPRQRLMEAGFVDPEIDRAWIAASEAALDEVEQAFERHGAPRLLRLHGDCHAGNVLWREDSGPHFVDLDDCCMGPAIQDLWMLLPGERSAVEAALHHLLDGYRDFQDFDDRELLLIEPLRTLRMIHHSAWLAERWRDPAFPIAFPWFASPAYWNQQTIDLREQIDRMQDRG
jgi:Ser/Thr protein kinase RdoA (MazF antagonist)